MTTAGDVRRSPGPAGPTMSTLVSAGLAAVSASRLQVGVTRRHRTADAAAGSSRLRRTVPLVGSLRATPDPSVDSLVTTMGHWQVRTRVAPLRDDVGQEEPPRAGPRQWLSGRTREPRTASPDAVGVIPHVPAVARMTTRRIELLVTRRPGPWAPADPGDAWLADLVRFVTSWRDPVLGTRMPVTGIRSPAAGFAAGQWARSRATPDVPVEGLDPHVARAAAAHLSVGMDEEVREARLALLADVLGYARDRGLGLHVSERQPSVRRGQWRCLHKPDWDGVATGAGPVAGVGGPLTSALVLGPASLDGHAALAQLLAEPGVGLVAVNQETLHRTDVWHALVRADEEELLDALGEHLGESHVARVGTEPVDFGEPLPEIDGVGDPDLRHYRACVWDGDAGAPDDAPDGYPVWAQWEIRDPDPARRDESLADYVVSLVAAQAGVAACRVESHKLSRSDARLQRERMKLLVTLTETPAPDDVDDALIRLCDAVQVAHRRRTPTDGEAGSRRHRVTNVRVAARERWLG